MRSVIVTGGSRGLGFAIACRLRDAGYRAIVVARKESDEVAADSGKPSPLQFR
jgi:NAD(P)-dependent dehydrogenase (short-subunit alcohol dehydrogenase family)